MCAGDGSNAHTPALPQPALGTEAAAPEKSEIQKLQTVSSNKWQAVSGKDICGLLLVKFHCVHTEKNCLCSQLLAQ